MAESFSNYAETSIRANRRFANLDGLSFFCINFFVVVVYWLSGGRISSGHLQIGDITAVIEYAMMQSAIASAERTFELLDEEEEVPDKAVPANVDRAEGWIGFEHVSFGYDPDKLLMKDISFKAEPGQKIAVVGSTGAGKTTLINLLMRFYEINGGSITVDGVPTTEISRSGLRKNFGMVLQDTWLFGGTIAENIAYGKADATR